MLFTYFIVVALIWLAFSVLIYAAVVELFIPWYDKSSVKTTQLNDTSVTTGYLRFNDPSTVKQVKLVTTNLPPIDVTLPMGSIMATSIVNVNEPVLLVSKQDDIRIYYPDNTIEYFSVMNKKWEKVKTSYKSVYEYANRSHSIIVENL